MSRLTRAEQETIINFNVAEDETVVFTRDKTVMRKLDALVTEFPDVYRCIRATDIDKTYSMPKHSITYHKARKISDKRREQMRIQMSQLNCKRNS